MQSEFISVTSLNEASQCICTARSSGQLPIIASIELRHQVACIRSRCEEPQDTLQRMGRCVVCRARLQCDRWLDLACEAIYPICSLPSPFACASVVLLLRYTMSVTLSHVSSSRSSLAHACLLWRNTVQQRWMRWRHVHSTEELKYANRFTCQLTVGMSDHDGPTANMRVTSSLPHHANRAFLVPKRFCACGILGELAEQGGPVAPVRVPFSERALFSGRRMRASNWRSCDMMWPCLSRFWRCAVPKLNSSWH